MEDELVNANGPTPRSRK
jgi:hypothetical protein